MNNQERFYNDIYTHKVYHDLDLPDFKITKGKSIVGKKILIFGIGTARDVKFLLGNNEVWGTDYSKESINVCKKLGIKIIKQDLNKPFKLKEKYFDIIVAKDILEHLYEPKILMNHIKLSLKRTGYAVINVPNHFYLPMRIRILLGKGIVWKTTLHDHTKVFNDWDYMHKIFFTWAGFQKFVETSGFKIEKKYFDFGTLNHYSQPELAIEYLEQTGENKTKLTILKTLWQTINFLIPKKLRENMVSLSPGLFCASFYVWLKKV
ncbi:hypothetical protein A3A76_03705 [Candidatus Woesebacteria bacterium RIFCSPLOWO2_01_FULL_39_23]|uniref:Methyltransferase type 11 domain-containing protein n=1 Tax=Candidatus Woesebacteria bacterium RIFCSPHIGHO2_01_FULL_40_22 TaxID=1802499 RepID=A0A1F7YKZ8_9BACT|nr:MAG: hypothetical protein A2141_00320 [Candidatus Woesebacteria bacterium RBG_16_40_11]OGM27559.1 MAG: hypothetical protein A2628_02105 [Candidatus Woesebacteria bacterium RIFCSPHIGHO2_01_FULL_40_22]OGM36150.1 MAG: hypothetical protein A3E41_02350 [Candidatus Woesebacteria bacterium RIFCSPHIGHO2_12_FULL_38_9]OGM62733.1 MAG: hypothetical protein A3A76_03705 [Candidatus Woesebacteria bacterium RIFCSPLOWO2_01_FULL_39_23]